LPIPEPPLAKRFVGFGFLLSGSGFEFSLNGQRGIALRKGVENAIARRGVSLIDLAGSEKRRCASAESRQGEANGDDEGVRMLLVPLSNASGGLRRRCPLAAAWGREARAAAADFIADSPVGGSGL
jgi:hypothetical protein